MGSREPLAGWYTRIGWKHHVMIHDGVELFADHSGWDVVAAAELNGHEAGLVPAQLAAEDAARALVAEMAAALGGRVAWNESEGSDG